jgi:transcriptional regulator with XRE-family HTH domain
VDLRAGTVRQARLEAGLTMAALGGDELTRQAVHLIEAGRARPSVPVLELIAERTGKPLSYFLVEGVPGEPFLGHPRLRDLQWLCLDRNYKEAVKLGNQLLERRLPRRSDAEARYYVGQALVQLGRPDEALPYLETARAHFEKLGDPWLAV